MERREAGERHGVVLGPELGRRVREEADPAPARQAALAHGGAEARRVQPQLEHAVRVAALEPVHAGRRRRRRQVLLLLLLLRLAERRAGDGEVGEAARVPAPGALAVVRVRAARPVVAAQLRTPVDLVHVDPEGVRHGRPQTVAAVRPRVPRRGVAQVGAGATTRRRPPAVPTRSRHGGHAIHQELLWCMWFLGMVRTLSRL